MPIQRFPVRTMTQPSPPKSGSGSVRSAKRWRRLARLARWAWVRLSILENEVEGQPGRDGDERGGQIEKQAFHKMEKPLRVGVALVLGDERLVVRWAGVAHID